MMMVAVDQIEKDWYYDALWLLDNFKKFFVFSE